MTALIKVRADTLKVGDRIMPPLREVNLWMRRHIQEKGLTESALYLRVIKIREGRPDKRGRWLVVSTEQTADWDCTDFNFRVRPETPWQKVS